MPIRVVVPPDPIVQPEEIPGGTVGDEALAALIGAVTEEIAAAGTGWLGRSLGPQTLQLTADCWKNFRLLYPPIIAVESVKYLDRDGVEREVDASNWRVTADNHLWFAPGWSRPSLGDYPDPIRVQYQAGYDGEDFADGGTGPLPARAKQAIIITVQHLRDVGEQNLFIRAVDIPDVERREFTVSDQASRLIRETCDRLLEGLRLHAI